MSEKKRRFFSGPSLEAALVSAASEYGLTPEEVSYRTVEKRHGFLKVRRNVVIQVDPDAPKKPDQPVKAVGSGRKEGSTADGRGQAGVAKPEPDEPDEPDEDEPDVVDDRDDKEDPGEAAVLQASAPEDEPEAADAEVDPGPSDERPPLRPRARGERRAAPSAPEEAVDRRSGKQRSEPGEKDAGRGREPSGKPGRGRGRRGEQGARDERGERDKTVDRERDPAPTRPLARPKRKPRELDPIEKRLERAEGELADGALEASEWLLDLVDLDVDPSIYEGEDRLEVELRGPDRDLIIDDDGKVLSALEHLIPRVMRGVCGDTHPVRVDSENFQELREDRLRERAWETADEVRTRGQAKILEAMDPADRRIVHLAISDDPEVTTRSLGEGFFKRVKVLPK